MSPILIVEDEYFIAADCVSEVERRGLRALAVGNLEGAMQLAQAAVLDAALVDLALRNERAFSVLNALRRRMIPVVLYTGYPRTVLPEQYRSLPLFQKPSHLTEAIDTLILLMESTTARKPEVSDFTGSDHQATTHLRTRTDRIELPDRFAGPELSANDEAALHTSGMLARDARVAQPAKALSGEVRSFGVRDSVE